MSKAFKKCLTLVLTFAMALCLFLGAANTVLADNGFTVDDVTTLAMGSGAEVRVATDDAERGLRFTATISEDDYDGLKNNADYSAVSFGMIIAPAEWTEIYELTEENVFGANAKYCWGEDQTGKAKIINLTANTLSNLDEDTRFMKGSIVGLQDFNIGREFVAKAYVKATDAEGDHYAFATYANGDKANNVRSMTAVALDAINDNSEFALDPDVKEELRKAYVAKSVAVECYLETGESTGLFNLAATKYVSAANGETVTVEDANLAVPEGYVVDEDAEGTKLSTVVNTEGANETLKVYCEKVAAQYTNNTGKFEWGAIKLDAGNLAVGTKVKVTFNFKTDITYQYTAIAFANTNNAFALEKWDGGMAQCADWTSLTIETVVGTGANIKSVMATWGDGAIYGPAMPVVDEEVGVYLAIVNESLENTSVWVKDVVVEELPAYAVNQNSGEYYSAIMIPTTVGEGGVVKVDYKIKTNDSAFLGVFWVGSTGAIDLDINIWTAGAPKCADWTTTTATVQVTNGPKAMQVFDAWADDPVADMGITGLANDVGIWLVFCNHTSGFVAVNDVEVTVISEPVSYDTSDADYVFVSPSSGWRVFFIDAEGFENGDVIDVTMSFKSNNPGVYTSVMLPWNNSGNLSVREPNVQGSITTGIYGVGFENYGAKDGYKEVIYTGIQVMDGASALQLFIDVWGAGEMAGATVEDPTAVGIYVLVPNFNVDAILAVKDVKLPEKLEEGYYKAEAAPSGYSHVMLRLDTEFAYLTEVNVSFKIKTTGITGNSGMHWRDSAGAHYYEAFPNPGWSNLGSCTDWTEISITSYVLDGAAASYSIGNVVPGAYPNDPAERNYIAPYADGNGVWLLFTWMNGTVEITDVVITAK